VTEEKDVVLDAGYIGADKWEKLKDRDVHWEIGMKRGKLKAVSEQSRFGQLLRKLESLKARIGSKVEHPFPHETT